MPDLPWSPGRDPREVADEHTAELVAKMGDRPAPSVPPVPDGLADRLREAVREALEAVRRQHTNPRTTPLAGYTDAVVDAVLAAPAVAAALASPPAADAVQRERQAVSAYLRHRAEAEFLAGPGLTVALRALARLVESGHVAAAMDVASPPAVPTGEPEHALKIGYEARCRCGWAEGDLDCTDGAEAAFAEHMTLEGSHG